MSKQAKHGTTCLILPSNPFVLDLTMHVHISSNPGPESNQEIISNLVVLIFQAASTQDTSHMISACLLNRLFAARCHLPSTH